MKKVGANSVKVRQINRGLILDALKNQESVSISDLAAETGLSIATCANILPVLVRSGAALELVGRESRGGRPARRFAFNPNHTLVASILFKPHPDGSQVIHAITNACGNTVTRNGRRIPHFSLQDLDNLLSDLGQDHPIKAVALALPGVISEGLILECDVPALVGVRIEDHIQQRHGLTAIVDNDVNFAAAGYHGLHATIPPAGLAFIVFPSGRSPGAGFVINGMLVRGKSNFAGEIGTIPLEQPPPDSGDAAAVAMGRAAAAVIAVLNPAILVISGDAVRSEMRQDILTACTATVPASHLPEMVFQPDYEDDSFYGMQAMALNCLDTAYTLVEKTRTWC